MGLGANARAALITRGLAEMARLGQKLGGHAETFMGLTGLGDLVFTATGDLSATAKSDCNSRKVSRWKKFYNASATSPKASIPRAKPPRARRR